MAVFSFFFFNDTATTEIYTLSLHDALPIWDVDRWPARQFVQCGGCGRRAGPDDGIDRKSTRLNSSHSQISYAVFCLKKKKSMVHRTWWPVRAASTAISMLSVSRIS